MVLPLIPAAIVTFFGSTIGSMVGFTSAGIGAGTFAALWQSWIGNVAGGSLFATLQSAGATGLGSVVGGVCGALYSIFN